MPNKSKSSGNSAEHLPIKIINPKQGREVKVQPGGPPSLPFKTVNVHLRGTLSGYVRNIEEKLKQDIDKLGVVPVRVELLRKAIAKTHRPEGLFSDRTCPIIGAGKLGELFIRATSDGLKKLDERILRADSAKLLTDISTVEKIEPISPENRLLGIKFEEVFKSCPKISNSHLAKVQLFKLNDGKEQEGIIKDFISRCKVFGITVDAIGYSKDSLYFGVACKDANDIKELSNIVSVRSIMGMPVFRSIKVNGMIKASIPTNLPQPVNSLSDYPIVAVVDSGVTDQIPALNSWIYKRDSFVAPTYRDTTHGTFVAGLACWAKELNPALDVDSLPCAIYDMQVISNNNDLTEPQLLQDLETALKEHSSKIKVWNLSLGADKPCSLDSFSSFAVELDKLQEKYKVSFVISAGNYETPPLLNYPRHKTQLDIGRITPPADSVLGITVGAISHKSITNAPNEGEPSAFSRHGAGPNCIIKPDLVHFGGTVSYNLATAIGVNSIYKNQIGEDCGTSFSAPIVSNMLANIYHNISNASPSLTRALLTHYARDPRNNNLRVPDEEVNYFGFGKPANIARCLECDPWTTTLIFEDDVRPGYSLEWSNFPYPSCLINNGKYTGDIWMTLAFQPKRDEKWGSEYCETHVDASFGIYRKDKDGKLVFHGQVPPEHSNPGELYEIFQVANSRKWAPVRTYFRHIGRGGLQGEHWRLKAQLLQRHNIPAEPQHFVLILSITDPTRSKDVYNDMSIRVNSRYQTRNMIVRVATRVQT